MVINNFDWFNFYFNDSNKVGISYKSPPKKYRHKKQQQTTLYYTTTPVLQGITKYYCSSGPYKRT